jgi:hypothetical protein
MIHVHDAACVAVALARAGYPEVTARCLRMLTRWAQDHGVPWVLAQVDDDPGLTFVATDEWFVLQLHMRGRGETALPRPWPKFGEDWR